MADARGLPHPAKLDLPHQARPNARAQCSQPARRHGQHPPHRPGWAASPRRRLLHLCRCRRRPAGRIRRRHLRWLRRSRGRHRHNPGSFHREFRDQPGCSAVRVSWRPTDTGDRQSRKGNRRYDHQPARRHADRAHI